MDTIFAVSSGRAPAAIAILRVSGPQAEAVARSLGGVLPTARRATLRGLRDGAGALLDRALMLWFPGPDTATGEDLLELHCHGGRAVIAAIETAIQALPGLRRAEAGEFTRRALAMGRIDLIQAEGLVDLLEAETEGQRRAAILATEGGPSDRVREWLDRLSDIRAAVEAEIDFSDEDDVVAQPEGVAATAIANLAREISGVLARPGVERLKDGVRVVLAGPPNAGKSSLFNAMIGRDAAIVTTIAGTTRDRIDASVVRGGIAYLVSDTAGLADTTDDPVERIGIARSRTAMASADVVLWLGDEAPLIEAAIWVHARCDIAGRETMPAGPTVAAAATLAETVDAVWNRVARRAADLLPGEDDYALNRRQRDVLGRAVAVLETAAVSSDLLVRAEDLRIAARTIAELIGVDATEALLDSLFGRFCIGK